MDRIRAGLTGLGAVFLVTAAASLLFAPDEAETVAASQQEPGEPLAQLGVAPGSDKTGEAGESGRTPAEPDRPTLEVQPSGGPAVGPEPADPAYPSPAGSDVAGDPGRPVAI